MRRSQRELARAIDRLQVESSTSRFDHPDDLTPDEKACLDEAFGGDVEPYGETDPHLIRLNNAFAGGEL
jgi:hypothetical protein